MKNTASFESLEAYANNPCIKCTEKIQKELASCLVAAGNDQKKIDACNDKYSKKWVDECKNLCNQS